MIELVRDPDSVKIGFYQSVLEDAGIQTHIRNADGSNMAGVMIPDVYPALCIVNESDVEQANALLSRIAAPVNVKADRVDKPWLVIWCSIILFGPLVVAGLVGVIWSIFAQGDVSVPVAVIHSESSTVIDITDINKTPGGFKVFVSIMVLLLGGFGLYTSLPLARRSLLKNEGKRRDSGK